MSGLFGGLSTTSSAIQAHSKAVELAGKNLANINNPNYARQRINTTSISSSANGDLNTVVTRDIQQVRDKFLDLQIVSERSYTASLEIQDARLNELIGTLGETIDRVNDPAFVSDSPAESGSVRGTLNSFFNAFENYAANPTDPSTKAVLMQSAESMVDSFNRADARLDSMSESIDSEVATELDAFNARMEELSDLNRKISRIEIISGEGSANDLRDERQGLLEEISQYVKVEVEEVPGSFGQVSVSVRDANGENADLLRPGFAPREIYYSSTSGAFRVGNVAADLDLQAGKLASLLGVKDNQLADVRSRMDALANAVATNVNEIYYQAFVPAGVNPAVPEVSFFAQPTPPPSVSGIASTVDAGSIALYTGSTDAAVTDSIALTQDSLRASHSDYASSNDLANAIAALSETKFSGLGGLRMADYAVQTAVGLGQDIESVSNQYDVQKSMELLMKDQRAQVSGVSMDEEMADLVQYQRAFQASSRVFSVMSEMLETIVSGLR